MKKVIITGRIDSFFRGGNFAKRTDEVVLDGTLSVSDGYHTMDELYEHRVVLFIALCKVRGLVRDAANEQREKREEKSLGPVVWRSLLHSDGSSYEGWFILGMEKEKGKQITYHLPLSYWGETDFAETLESAPKWDKHTPADVITRLKEL